MKTIGVVHFYNGKYGAILTEKETIDFSIEDISFQQELHEGDRVIFRVEERFPTIKLARNIMRIDNVSKSTTEKEE